MKLNYNLSRTKDYSGIDLDALKSHLFLTSDDTEFDNFIRDDLYPAAVDEAEAYIKKDIVPTVNTYDITDFTGYMITLPSSNYKGEISVVVNAGAPLTEDDDFKVTAGQTMGAVIIELTDPLKAADLQIIFETGYLVIPPRIEQAIRVGCSNMFDPERSGYIAVGYKKTDVYERLLNTARNLFGATT